MSDYSNLQKITKQELMKKYNLTERQYSNLRKRYSERILNAKQLYLWGESDVPSITKLIDYSLKYKKQRVQQFDIILETPTTRGLSLSARRNALDIYSGEKGSYNRGFYTFSKGIPQFLIMKSNAEKRLSRNGQFETMEKLPHFRVGMQISTSDNYFIKNNEYGRKSASELNSIVDEYNANIDKTTQNSALQFYIIYVRKMMNVIHFAEEHDAIAGS